MQVGRRPPEGCCAAGSRHGEQGLDETASGVRPARRNDLEAILAIEAAAFEPTRRTTRAALRRALQSPFQRVWVLDVDGAVGGYLVLWPFPHTWRVYNLAAHPQQRNRGVGSRLLAAAVGAAGAAGARRLVLESRREPGLVQFYERRGFRVSHVLPDYYGPGEDAVRMELPLAPAAAG